MDRRSFLHTAGAVLTASAVLPLASGCGLSGASSPNSSPAAHTPESPDWKLGLPRVSSQMIGPYLVELAARTGSAPLARSFEAWRSSRGGADREFLASLRDEMAAHGFTDYGTSQVYDAGEAFFYAVGNSDGLNGCTPVLVTTDQGNLGKGAMVESPLAIGLTLLAREWSGPDGVTAADALIPRAAIVDHGMGFERSLTEPPYVYRTRTGTLVFDYQAQEGKEVGTLSLMVKGRTDEVQMAREYRVAWG